MATGLFNRPMSTTDRKLLECCHRAVVAPDRPSAWCQICTEQVPVAR